MWVPPWDTIEPYEYKEKLHVRTYGTLTEGKLLSGLAGHSLCLDYFGLPSPEEAASGLSLHGEAPSSKWKLTAAQVSAMRASLKMSVELSAAGLDFEREISINKGQEVIYFSESVRNLRKMDHFFHWTQHVSLGPQFLSPESSAVSLPGTRAITYPHGYDEGKALLASGQEFTWPHAPLAKGGQVDLSRPFCQKGLGFVVAVLLDKTRELGFVAALNRDQQLLIAYCFRRCDFPWVAIWEENLAITAAPWKERTQARGLEFGTTPLPVARRESFTSGYVLGEPTQTVVPALGVKTVKYVAFLTKIPSELDQVREIIAHEDEIVISGAKSSNRCVIKAPAIRAYLS
jgi:hypothetical protein